MINSLLLIVRELQEIKFNHQSQQAQIIALLQEQNQLLKNLVKNG